MQIWNKITKVSMESETLSEGWTSMQPQMTQYEGWDEVNQCWGISFVLLQSAKQNEINTTFTESIASGHFTSTTLGIEVDCRRNGTKNDYQNCQGLLSVMTDNNIPSVQYKGVSEQVTITQDQLVSLIKEMAAHVLALYQHKWDVESQISLASTSEQLQEITW